MKQKKQKQQSITPIQKYKLYTAALICGLCVMVLELVGSRMIAPFLGASIVVWTSLIGVIMASLAAGYYVGGRIADARPSTKLLAGFMAAASLWIVLLAFAEKSVMRLLLSGGIENIYALSVIAALLFFAVPSFLLAGVSPFVIRLLAASQPAAENANIGRLAGRVSAISTVGSIVGTFLGGFVLVSFFSVTVILLLVSLALLVAAALTFSAKPQTAIALCLAAIGAFALQYHLQKTLVPQMAIETQYNSLFVAEYIEDGRPVRALYTDSEKMQGRMYVDSPTEIAADYLRFAADYFANGKVKTMLMLGGGVYVLPRWLTANRPDISIDIVEIDPGVTQAARTYFYLASRPGQRIIHEDARYFVNRMAHNSRAKYDLIFQDSYGSSLNVPFQLASAEHFAAVSGLLSEDGVFLLNFIGSIDSAMFAGLYAALANAFTNVLVFPVNEPDNPKAIQNIMLAASINSHVPIAQQSYHGTIPQTVAFTDGFAPVELRTMQMMGGAW